MKASWGFGWRGGLNDPSLFAGVTFFTPGFGDTVVLTGIGMALVILMAVPITRRGAQPLLLLGGEAASHPAVSRHTAGPGCDVALQGVMFPPIGRWTRQAYAGFYTA